MSFQRDRISRIGMTVYAAALLAAAPPLRPAEPEPQPDPSKVSRQHKRWLERQARKQERKHRKR